MVTLCDMARSVWYNPDVFALGMADGLSAVCLLPGLRFGAGRLSTYIMSFTVNGPGLPNSLFEGEFVRMKSFA